MEINYDLIIKYLTKNSNTFSNKKNILSYSDSFCTKFTNLLQNKFYKYGITINDDKNKNISFYSSFLTLINKDFVSLNLEEELKEINKFKTFIDNSVKTFTPSQYLKKYLDDNKLINIDLTNNLDVYYIQSIVEIFNINMIILDFTDEKIYTLYPDEQLNPWKPTLLFAKSKDWWEPIIYEQKTKRTFSFNDTNIKKIILEGDIEYYCKDIIKKNFIVNINIEHIIEEYKPQNNNEINDTFIKQKDEPNDLVKLNKMTKTELTDICKNKNIKITSKMLKKEIIDLIINN